jgi:hypothetical protein
VRHKTVHHIRTTPGPPVICHPHRLAPERLTIAKAEFDATLRDGTARRYESSWSSVLRNCIIDKEKLRRWAVTLWYICYLVTNHAYVLP